MEHRFSLNTQCCRTRNITFVLYFLLLISLSACKEAALEHPELVDPIYIDIGNDAKASDTGLESERKSLEDAKKSLKESPVHDPLRGQLQREISKRERKIVEFEQRSLFYKIQQEKRKEWIDQVYPKRYEADLPWPDTKEVTEYKKMKALRTASMNWSDRVPKTTRYQKQQPAAPEKPKAEHGE